MQFTSKSHPRFDPERFTEHRVERYTFGDFGGVPYEIMWWKRPGTITRSLRFFRLGAHLYVSGDYYDATYAWSGVHTLAWMADTDFGYFHEKCVASRKGAQPEIHVPEGWDCLPDCIIHHGALRLAVQWLDRTRPNALKL